MIAKIFIIFFLCVSCSFASTEEQAVLEGHCIKIIKEGLNGSNDDVRIESLILMGKNKIIDSTAEKKVIDKFTRLQSDYERAAAIYWLSHVDNSIIALLRQTIENESNFNLSRIAAAVALYNLGEKNAFKVIETYLNGSDIGLAIEAARSAGQLNDGNSILLLRTILNKKSGALKIGLLESLARLGDKISDDEISFLLKNNDVWPALKIIRLTGNKKYMHEVEKAINSNNPLLRIEASAALLKIGGPKSKKVIKEYLESKQDKYGEYSGEDVRLFALDALAEVGDTSDLPLLRKYLDSQNQKERVAAAGAILALLKSSASPKSSIKD